MEYSRQLDQAVELLFSRVPDFANARSIDSSFMSLERHDSPYLVFGDFGLFLLQQLNDKEIGRANYERLRPSFQLIDEMLTSTDPELANLIQVGVLEVLSDQPSVVEVVKRYLSANGKEKLESGLGFHRRRKSQLS